MVRIHYLLTVEIYMRKLVWQRLLYHHQILLYFVFLPGHTGRPFPPSFPREQVLIMWLNSGLWEKVMQSPCSLALINISSDPPGHSPSVTLLSNIKAWDQVFILATRWTLTSFILLKYLPRFTMISFHSCFLLFI